MVEKREKLKRDEDAVMQQIKGMISKRDAEVDGDAETASAAPTKTPLAGSGDLSVESIKSEKSELADENSAVAI